MIDSPDTQWKRPALCLPEYTDMKKSIALVAILLIAGATDLWSQAGAANMIKGKARDAAGRPAPPKTGGPMRPGGSTVGRPASPARPAPSASRSSAKLIESDLSLIRIKTSVTDELRDRLAGHVLEAAGSEGKANPEAVKKLAFEVATAMQKHKLGYGERKQLASSLVLAAKNDPATANSLGELETVLGAAGMPKSEIDQLMASFKQLAPAPSQALEE